MAKAATFTGIAKTLLQHQLLDEAGLLQAQEQAKAQHQTLIEYLVAQRVIGAETLLKYLSRDFNIPQVSLSCFDKANMPLNLLTDKLIEKHHAIPLFKRGNRLFLGVSDPTQLNTINEIRFHTGLSIAPILVAEDQLQKNIQTILREKNTSSLEELHGLDDAELDALDMSAFEEDNTHTKDELQTNDAPMVRFVNKIILDAIHLNASDIHFEPYETKFRIRYRRDGALYEVASPPIHLALRMVSRVKIMANLDISEHRIPQDGRFKIQLSRNRSMGFRVSTCPTLFGEKVVLRILDPTTAMMGIDNLGFFTSQKDQFMEAVQKSQGMILITGPTGSGKTVTSYTALNILNTIEKNISTVEDPVEIYVAGINQVNVNLKTGLTFATALRAFLRQDPDIIMVGEIRDTETAEIGIKAAQTGHLVLSTLHTNSAADTLTRLENMGIASYNVATSVKLVIAQRLVRRLCEYCKQKISIPPEALLEEGFNEAEVPGLQVYEAKGCQHCMQGYKGRLGIYEVMPITRGIQMIIMSNGNALDIADQAVKEGMINLRRAGLNKVAEGITSLEEVNRATKE